MNEEKYNSLINKYLAAETTLNEEEKLFNAKISNPTMQAWFTYAKQKSKKTPANLHDSIWTAIQTRKKRRQRFLYGLSGAAASIILFIIISVNTTNNTTTSNEEKKALLSEALTMFSDEKQTMTEQDIIYEDDIIIIYTKSK